MAIIISISSSEIKYGTSAQLRPTFCRAFPASLVPLLRDCGSCADGDFFVSEDRPSYCGAPPSVDVLSSIIKLLNCGDDRAVPVWLHFSSNLTNSTIVRSFTSALDEIRHREITMEESKVHVRVGPSVSICSVGRRSGVCVCFEEEDVHVACVSRCYEVNESIVTIAGGARALTEALVEVGVNLGSVKHGEDIGPDVAGKVADRLKGTFFSDPQGGLDDSGPSSVYYSDMNVISAVMKSFSAVALDDRAEVSRTLLFVGDLPWLDALFDIEDFCLFIESICTRLYYGGFNGYSNHAGVNEKVKFNCLRAGHVLRSEMCWTGLSVCAGVAEAQLK